MEDFISIDTSELDALAEALDRLADELPEQMTPQALGDALAGLAPTFPVREV
jgi:hypothetical protein